MLVLIPAEFRLGALCDRVMLQGWQATVDVPNMSSNDVMINASARRGNACGPQSHSMMTCSPKPRL